MEFDLQAHRGGLGLTVENTLAAFQRALEVGVSTLEMDVQITLDGQAVVAHDRDPQPERCLDTGPAWPGDPMFPYVRDETYLAALTLDQVRTIDVGSLGHPAFPDQVLVPGARMPLLAEVLDLVRSSDGDVRLSIEFKIESVAGRTAPAERFVEVVVPLLAEAGLADRTAIQCFEWTVLPLVCAADPRLRLAALADTRHTSEPDWVDAIVRAGADICSPNHALLTPELIERAHASGLTVIPWTVDDPEELRRLIGLGIDGVITNRPDTARVVMADVGLPLPPAQLSVAAAGGEHDPGDRR